jgi:hypothetical protein
VIGIVSVVVMLGIGKGAEIKLMESMGDFAKNQIQINRGWSEDGKKQLFLTPATVKYLEAVFPELEGKISYSASNYMSLPIKSEWGGYEGMSYYGVPSAWFENTERKLLYGSHFTT